MIILGFKAKNITSHKQKQAVAWKILFQYPFAAPTSLSCFKLSLPQSRMDRQRFSLPPSGICFQEKFTTPGTFNIFGFKWKRYNSPALCDHCSNELLLAEASTVYHFNKPFIHTSSVYVRYQILKSKKDVAIFCLKSHRIYVWYIYQHRPTHGNLSWPNRRLLRALILGCHLANSNDGPPSCQTQHRKMAATKKTL